MILFDLQVSEDPQIVDRFSLCFSSMSTWCCSGAPSLGSSTRLRRLHPNSERTRTLQFLVEGRRKFVHEKVRYSNRLTPSYLSPGEPAIQLKHAGAPGVSEAAEVSVQDVL